MHYKMIAAFVDKHSVLCELCTAIVCWRGPVHNNTVACCFIGGHRGWETGVWKGRLQLYFTKYCFGTN